MVGQVASNQNYGTGDKSRSQTIDTTSEKPLLENSTESQSG
jgi:hypothetical protein